MTMSDSARSRSTASATNAGVAAAGSTTTRRSTLPGRLARFATQRTPSMRSVPGLMTVTAEGSKPSRRTLPRMTRPGPPRDETPTMAMDRGASSRATFASGRGARTGRGPSPSLTSTSSATRPSGVTAAGLTSSSVSSSGQSGARAMTQATASARRAAGRRAGWPRSGVVARRTAVAPARACTSRSRLSGGVRDGETIATSAPGRRSAASASVRIPPAPTATTAPMSSVQRRDSRSSPPGPVSWGTKDETVNPSGASGRRARMSAIASRTAAGFRDTIATPPTSVLCRTAAATTLTTTRSPGNAARSVSSTAVPCATKAQPGTASPAAARSARPSGSRRVGRPAARAPARMARIASRSATRRMLRRGGLPRLTPPGGQCSPASAARRSPASIRTGSRFSAGVSGHEKRGSYTQDGW